MARESLQKKIDRVRPPRVEIVYEVETGGAVEKREVPLVIGVMGDFSCAAERRLFSERRFQSVDFDNFDEVLAGLKPRVRVSLSDVVAGGGNEIDLEFRSLAEFEPESLIRRVPVLAALRDAGEPDGSGRQAKYVDEILHAREFQRIEAAWRGLWYLVSQTNSSAQMVIRILDVTKKELLRDLQRALEVDQTRLFKVLYEEPYTERGAAPFGLLVGNYEFGTAAEDVELLSGLATLARICHAPFAGGAAPEMFGAETFANVEAVRNLGRVFDAPEYARWNAFRDSEDARYAALALPRVLMRSPYGFRPGAPGDNEHVEEIKCQADLLWGNAAFAFGTCVANAFTRYGWCGAIRGLEGGGLVEGLATWVSEGGGRETRSGLEVMLSDRREKELSDLGFLPLAAVRQTDMAVFFSVQSCCRPRFFDNAAAASNSRLLCQLSYVLTASRFMHYMKMMARDVTGSYQTRGGLEQRLNQWIASYVNVDDQSSSTILAKHPLREAKIEVSDDPGQPGVYRVVAFLRPYFQLAELSVSMRVVGQIP